jgi:hypothetical protein
MRSLFGIGNVAILAVLLLAALPICGAVAEETDTLPARTDFGMEYTPFLPRSGAPIIQFESRPITRHPYAPILIFEPDPSIDYKILVWEPPPRDYRILGKGPGFNGPRLHSPPRIWFRDLVPDLPDRPTPLRPRLRYYGQSPFYDVGRNR